LSSRHGREAAIDRVFSQSPLCFDTVEKLDFLSRSRFMKQQAGFKKKALWVRRKG